MTETLLQYRIRIADEVESWRPTWRSAWLPLPAPRGAGEDINPWRTRMAEWMDAPLSLSEGYREWFLTWDPPVVDPPEEPEPSGGGGGNKPPPPPPKRD